MCIQLANMHTLLKAQDSGLQNAEKLTPGSVSKALCAEVAFSQFDTVDNNQNQDKVLLSDMRLRLAKVAGAIIDAVALLVKVIELGPHGVLRVLNQGEVHTWKLLLSLLQASPCVTS